MNVIDSQTKLAAALTIMFLLGMVVAVVLHL